MLRPLYGNVNSAKNDASFHNTVTIYNGLKAVSNNVSTISNNVSTTANNVTTLITNLANVGTSVSTVGAALATQIAGVDTDLAGRLVALDAHLVTLVDLLKTQISQGTALLGADLRQVMKLELTPDGQKQINPAILTCTGTNCPNVLAACPAAGCSWNNVGPLP